MDPEEMARFHLAGRAVCDQHVVDPWLKGWIAAHADSVDCDYCDRRGNEPVAAPVDLLADVVLDGLSRAYGNADDEGVPVDGGAYVFETQTSLDLIYEEEVSDDDDFAQELADAMPHDCWVQRDFFRLTPFQRMRTSWDDFRQTVKHRSRYLFAVATNEGDRDVLTPLELLGRVGETLLDEDLLIVCGTEGSLFRARPHARDEDPGGASALATVPRHLADRAAANRMSAAGVPLFYGAFDEETALAETLSTMPSPPDAVTVGRFEPLRPLRLLDLREPPPVPSLFDPARGHRRGEIAFLTGFVDDIAREVTRDGREHIDYVPTQVVTEFFRSVFKHPDGNSIDGIVWCALQREGGENVVLFLDNEHAIDADGTRDVPPEYENAAVSLEHLLPEPVLVLRDAVRHETG